MKNKIQEIDCCFRVCEIETLSKKDLNLPPKQKFTLFITYPIASEAQFVFNTGTGMGTLGVIGEIGKAYEKIYADPDKYGVWGHSIGDLFIERIFVDYGRKEIKLYVGS